MLFEVLANFGPKKGQKWSKMVKNGLKRAKNGQKNGQKHLFMPFYGFGQFWPKMPKNGQKWSKNGLEWSKMALFRPKIAIFSKMVFRHPLG